jgi:hypothetical protein
MWPRIQYTGGPWSCNARSDGNVEGPALQNVPRSTTMNAYHMHRKQESGMLEGKSSVAQDQESSQL